MILQPGSSPEMETSEALNGLQDRIPKLSVKAVGRNPKFIIVYWTEATVPHHTGIHIGLLTTLRHSDLRDIENAIKM